MALISSRGTDQAELLPLDPALGAVGSEEEIAAAHALDPGRFAGTEAGFDSYSGGVFRSTDNGANWTAMSTGLTAISVSSLVVSGTNIFAGTDNGVFLSTNDGTSWTSTGIKNRFVTALNASGTNLFAANNYRVFLSTDNGTNWTEVDTGFQVNVVSSTGHISVFSFAANGKNLFAGTNGGIWKRPLSEMVTGVEDNHKQMPTRFTLDQNYPNPFNPTTSISFILPTRSFVSLKVFDLLGREVATIVSEEMSAGSHTKQWNAENYTSGVYFYRLQAGTYTETKKLVLLK
ncbi:MAG: T9SS type A sorting domain-containing protein [Bacteroidales bacterium]